MGCMNRYYSLGVKAALALGWTLRKRTVVLIGVGATLELAVDAPPIGVGAMLELAVDAPQTDRCSDRCCSRILFILLSGENP
jgi:hypothetical protein